MSRWTTMGHWPHFMTSASEGAQPLNWSPTEVPQGISYDLHLKQTTTEHPTHNWTAKILSVSEETCCLFSWFILIQMLGAQCIKWPSNGMLMSIILCDISPNIMNIYVWNVEFEVYTKHYLILHILLVIQDTLNYKCRIPRK